MCRILAPQVVRRPQARGWGVQERHRSPSISFPLSNGVTRESIVGPPTDERQERTEGQGTAEVRATAPRCHGLAVLLIITCARHSTTHGATFRGCNGSRLVHSNLTRGA